MSHPLITIDQLIQDSWSTVKSEWRKTLRYTLLPLVIAVALSILSSVLGAIFKELDQNIWYRVLSFVPGELITAWYTVRLFKHLLKQDHGQHPTPQDTRLSARDVIAVVIIFLLTFIICLAGTILLILPGIWIANVIAFGTLSYLEDHKTGIAALKDSQRLVQGRWWATFGRRFVPALVAIGVMLGAGIAFLFAVLLSSGIVFGIGFVLHLLIVNAIFTKVLIVLALIWCLFLFIALIAFEVIVRIGLTLFHTSVYIKLFHALKQTPPPAPSTQT